MDNDDLEYEHIIMAGDFNVAPEHAEDISGYLHVNNLNTRRFLKTHAALNNLTNIWHDRNPGKKDFTFYKWQRKNQSRARIDFFWS